MKKRICQMYILIFAMLVSPLVKSNTLAANDYSSNFSEDTCEANIYYVSLGNGEYIFYDSASVYGDDAEIEWNINGTKYYNVHTLTHTFPTGTVNVQACLKITSGNHECTACNLFVIEPENNIHCDARFKYYLSDTVYSGFKRVYLENHSESNDPIVTSTWSYGDGEFSTIDLPYHDYHSPFNSTYSVLLYITTLNGCYDSVFYNVYVPDSDSINDECLADFSFEVVSPDSIMQNYQDVRFFNHSSSTHTITSYIWDFGNGEYSNETNPTHRFYTPSDTLLNIGLTISSTSGCLNSKVQEVLLPGFAGNTDSCTADFIYNFDELYDEPGITRVQFENSSTVSETVVFMHWTFGDGASDHSMYPVHDYYLRDTTLLASLSIITVDGCKDTTYKEIYIPVLSDTSYSTCHADFTYAVIESDSLGSSYTHIAFDNTSSGIMPVFLWSFGDNNQSTDYSPSHIYSNEDDETVVMVSLAVTTEHCTDTVSKEITLPGIKPLFSMSGFVTGKGTLLPQGTIVLYYKTDDGYFDIREANVINNGNFYFDGLEKGRYLLYAMPHMYYSGQYLPTYYANKLHWFRADEINLESNTGDIHLQMATTLIMGKGPGRISGKINRNFNKNTQSANPMAGNSDIVVYLYTESGEVISVCTPDENNDFAFNDLLYGTYTLRLESVNLIENKTTVTLSPETPAASGIDFNIEGFLVGVSKTVSESDVKMYFVSDESLGIIMNKAGFYKVTVVNMAGNVVFESTEDFSAAVEKQIHIGNVVDGIYLIRLQGSSVISRKIKK